MHLCRWKGEICSIETLESGLKGLPLAILALSSGQYEKAHGSSALDCNLWIITRSQLLPMPWLVVPHEPIGVNNADATWIMFDTRLDGTDAGFFALTGNSNAANGGRDEAA